ncbi:MAG TPA: MaoC/PaaZ C-terminal domain-containing protein [Beutenbergiaceae bacterium]|nr:MaoC/PaaZ C-terminal domain-containing protein [Beutenbergiaceae bacterium]
MRTRTLQQVPTLAGLYSKALGRTAQAAAPAVLARRSQPTRLPEVRYAVEEVPVDAGHLGEYQRLLGEPGTDDLPAGYVHVLAFPLAMAVMVRPDFPLPVLGMVHVANRVDQHHQLHAGEVLRMRAWAEGLRAHRSGTQVDLVVEVAGQEGPEVAWRGVSTYLAKGTRVPGLALAEPAGAGPGGQSPGGAAANTQADLPEQTAMWTLDKQTARAYAAISGDRNPIHTSAVGARAFGFPRPIAHGMYTAARALSSVGTARGSAFTWEVEFAKPVLLPSGVAVGLQRRESGGYDYAGWRPRDGRVNFTGSVRPAP